MKDPQLFFECKVTIADDRLQSEVESSDRASYTRSSGHQCERQLIEIQVFSPRFHLCPLFRSGTFKMQELPRYVANPLMTFNHYMDQSQRLLHLSLEGIRRFQALPQVVQVLRDTDPGTYSPEESLRKEQEFEQELQNAKAQAAFALREHDEGFPLLHAQALVGVWSAFEAAIEDALVGILLNESELLRSEAFLKVRIPLAEFEVLEKEERFRYLLNEVSRGRALSQKQGIDQFETQLSLVGLGGSIDSEVKRLFWEMSHLRNIVVHRGAVADRRIVQACPWLNLKIGDKVKITHANLHVYHGAFGKYLMAIIHRAGLKYGVDIELLIARSRECQP